MRNHPIITLKNKGYAKFKLFDLPHNNTNIMYIQKDGIQWPKLVLIKMYLFVFYLIITHDYYWQPTQISSADNTAESIFSQIVVNQ